MVKRFAFLTIIVFFCQLTGAFSQIILTVADPGPYTPGSGITAMLELQDGSCLKPGNVFELYLSDASGNFSGNNRIGTYNGFYATFVNGIIPAVPPGMNYRLQVRSTNPAFVSNPSATFEIKAGATVSAAVGSSPELPTAGPSATKEAFGRCPGIPNVVFDFTNASTPSSVVTASIKNELSKLNVASLTFSPESPIQSFTAPLGHYTLIVKASLNGTVSTKAYMLINNTTNNSFGTTGGSIVCLPGGYLQFPVDLSQNGIKNNYPGTTYQIDWGDSNGRPEVYTLCDLQLGYVRHEYLLPSCGRPVYNTGTGPRYNVFGINIAAVSPFCGITGGELSTYVKVVKKPENSFNYPATGCTGSTINFVNTSLLGESEANNPICADNDVKYNWYVDNVKKAANLPRSAIFQYLFTTPGTYAIKLESVTSGQCNGESVTHQICIQNPPKPDFDFNGIPNTHCAPFEIQAHDKSILDNSCGTNHTYNWVVTKSNRNANSSEVTFINGIPEPTFKFLKQGTYEITLKISSAACGEVSTAPPQRIIIIDSAPTITLAAKVDLCRPDLYKYDDQTTGPTKVIFFGTELDAADTYTWAVTAADGTALTNADFSFENGTNVNSKFPAILFKQYLSYKVAVTHKNSCGSITKEQLITFYPSPIVKITADKNPICYDASVNLTGVVSNGSYTGTRWVGAGTFSNQINNLSSNYIPTQQERDLHKATIKLIVSTNLTGLCAEVEDVLEIAIFPNNTGTNTAQQICSGLPLSYDPATGVSLPGSSFSWTAKNTDLNAGSSFSPAGSGKILDVIVNSSSTNNAVVVYEITPSLNGCAGIPFTFTVTVYPKPSAAAALSKPVICSGERSGITLTPSFPGIKYTWTSTTSNGVTGNHDQPVPTTTAAINETLINTGALAGTVTYKIIPISATGCPGEEITVSIAVDPAVTAATAGMDVSICDALTYTLDGNHPKSTETGTWLLTSGQTGVTFSDLHSPNMAVSGLVAGETYTFSWTISGTGICNPSVANVSITVNPPTIAGILTADRTTVCYGVNTGQITLTGHIGTVQRWESSTDGSTWLIIDNATPALTFSNLTLNTQYRAVLKNGACGEKTTAAIPITVIPAISIATAGPDQQLCNVVIFQLSGNTPNTGNGEIGRWTMIQGDPNALITDPGDPQTTVTAVTPGTYKFRWTISGSAICDPTADELSITNLPRIVNTIGNPSPVVCYGQVITITNTVLSGGDNTYTYVWENSRNGTDWSVIPDQNGADLNFSLQETLSFRRTVRSGTCMELSNAIRIIALPPISNNTISAAQTICSGLIPAKLEGTFPQGANGSNYLYQWQSSIDGSTWADIPGAKFQDYQPDLLSVTTFFRRVAGSIECSGALQHASSPITITIKPNAKAVFSFSADKGCIPFNIDSENIKALLFPAGNETYTWYADGVKIGEGLVFPGYTISNSNQSVVIKLITGSSQNCLPDEFSHTFSTQQNVAAAYTQSATEGCGPLLVNFVNTSTSLTNATFKWDFGNGMTSTQTIAPPVTFLPDPSGDDISYTVTLTAITSCGENTFTSTILVKAKPKAVFSPDKVTGCSPMKVTFSNTSPGATNTFYYDFGDGTPVLITRDKSPVEHTYNTLITQDFTVKMIAENECGTDEQSFVIRVAPNTITPELVVNANEKDGCAPFTVKFYNNSKGANLFKYDFGDGATLLTRTAPEVVPHTFERPGTYTVTLTASNGCSVVSTSETITVLEQPLTAFSANNTTGCPGMEVKFINTSTGAVSQLWDFGDGTSSNEFEPSHFYSGQGPFYTVTLTTTNGLGCTHRLIQSNFIHIVSPPIAQFSVKPGIQISIPNYTFSFTDESSNTPDQWTWDFGDHTSSALKNPSHTYLDTGLYKVTLRVSNQQGCFTETNKSVRITGVPGYLFLPNSFIPGSETNELRLFSAKGSGIRSWQFSIYDKWGEKMWETSLLEEGRPVEGWDGTFKGQPMPQGVYYWKVEVQMINGSEWKGMTYGSAAPKRTGPIHLIR